MRKIRLRGLSEYMKQSQRRRGWRKLVQVMACIVVFCTTYALILPAITMENDLVCGLEEHTHSESCYTQVTAEQVKTLSCTYESLGIHIHTEDCYDAENSLLCGLSDYVAHSHDAACIDAGGALVCALEEIPVHTHTDGCYPAPELICGLEEAEAHAHMEDCYQADGTLICSIPETEGHAHADSCYETADTLICGKAEVILHTHEDACYETITDETGAEQKVLICTQPVLEEHIHGEGCFTTTEVAVDTENLTCTLEESEEHTHGAMCYGTWEMTCGMEAHVHNGACYPSTESTEETNPEESVPEETDPETGLTEAEQADVNYVISLIDEMPSADEIDAKLAEFEEAEDYEGEEEYYTIVSQQVTYTYNLYAGLTDAQKALVTNADKVLELDYIWSVTTLSEVATVNVNEVNSYTAGGNSVIIVRGGRGCTVQQAGVYQSDGFEYWYAIVVHLENGQYVVKEVNPPQQGLSKLNVYAPYDGFVLLIHADIAGNVKNVKYGDYVYMSGSFWRHTTAYTGETLGRVTFYDQPVSHSTPFWSPPTQVTQNVADTDEFVELNLYNYGLGSNTSDVNSRFYNETYTYNGYSDVTLWPGFQWNGGAYNLGGTFHRHQVDYIDFGNSLITDLQYGTQISASYSYAKSANAVSVGKLYTNSAANETGIINTLWWDGTNNSSITNRPIGMAMVDGTSDDVLKPILTPTGYPVILASDSVSGFSGVLDYLFTDNAYAKKVNNSTINGLFQINPTSGEYFFNSRWNHAQYNSATNRFDLYEEVITPNFIVYPFGNFMPFNKITDGLTSANVKDIEAGTLKNYLAEEISQKLSYSDSSESQLRTMLSLYRSSLDPDTAGSAWNTYSGLQAIQDYFWGDSSGSDDTPSEHTSDLTELVNNGDLYNIDFDVHSEFFFGMDMSMRFYQPKDGLTGYDNGNNASGTWSTVSAWPEYRRSALYVEEDTQILSGSPDGIPDYPMVFYFTGDDDVWVFLDGMLFLDLTGIHRHVGGEIDFQKGVVNYYELDVANSGDISKTPYRTFTFAQLVDKAIRFRHRNEADYPEASIQAEVNAIVNPDTGRFYDYSIHEFKFFYMERGSGSSVCRMNFNFPLLKQNTLAVEKLLSDDDTTEAVEALGNPDFKFQILNVDEKDTETTTDDEKTEQSFFAQYDAAGSQWAYTLYDTDGSLIQEVKVTEKHADGTVKELCVYNYESGEQKLVRKEYEVVSGDTVTTKIENYPENGPVYTINPDGTLTLKAGQRAEFTGIPENWGRYYVRELLDPDLVGQYGNITVSGTAVNQKNVTVGGVSFVGMESPILNMGDGSSTFTFQNRITTEKLGRLQISKAIEDGGYESDLSGRTFKFKVTLDGKPLPEGTTYKVGEDTKTVTVDKDDSGTVTASYVEIAAGQTAVIENILAGAQYEVTEADESREGFTVSYKVDGEDVTTDPVTGTIGVASTVEVIATNKISSAEVNITVNKSYALDDGKEHTYTFRLTQVADAQGNTLEGGTTQEKTVTFDANTKSFVFELGYASYEFDSLPQTRYYMITEDAAADSMPNNQSYIAQIVIAESSGELTATLEKMWVKSGDTYVEHTTNSADFVNTLVGSLSLEKIVSGSSGSGFNFTVTLKPGTSGVDPLPTTFEAYIVPADKDPYWATIQFENGVTRITEMHHGKSIIIYGIPIGVEWTIEEESVDGYVVGTTVTNSSGTVTDTGTATNGSIETGTTQVVYTNTQTYVLPETGGTGTVPYTMAGLVLMLFSIAYLMYRPKARGRGSYRSA